MNIVELIKCVNKKFNDSLKAEFKINQIPIKLKHVDLFMILYKEYKEIEFKNLVKILGLSKSTTSDTVTKYEKLGLIKKEHKTTDKRLLYISLTEKGEKYSHKIDEIRCDFLTNVNSIIGEDNDDLKKFLKKII